MKTYLKSLILACIVATATMLPGLAPPADNGNNVVQKKPAKEKEESGRAKQVKKPKVKKKPVAYQGCDRAYNYDWPGETARAICLAESSGDTTEINWDDDHKVCRGSYGLMQNACFWFPFFGYSLGQAHDPAVNMSVAYKIWQRQGGFSAWTTYTSGKYLKHL